MTLCQCAIKFKTENEIRFVDFVKLQASAPVGAFFFCAHFQEVSHENTLPIPSVSFAGQPEKQLRCGYPQERKIPLQIVT
jgi:hypothetical protein